MQLVLLAVERVTTGRNSMSDVGLYAVLALQTLNAIAMLYLKSAVDAKMSAEIELYKEELSLEFKVVGSKINELYGCAVRCENEVDRLATAAKDKFDAHIDSATEAAIRESEAGLAVGAREELALSESVERATKGLESALKSTRACARSAQNSARTGNHEEAQRTAKAALADLKTSRDALRAAVIGRYTKMAR